MAKINRYVTLKIKVGKVMFSKRKRIDAALIIENEDAVSGLTDPGDKHISNNNHEFTAIAKAGKSFRSAIAPVSNLADVKLTTRLIKIFNSIKNKSGDNSRPRPILISKHRTVLREIDLNTKRRLYNTLSAPFTTSHPETRDRATVVVKDVSIDWLNGVPPSATHFRLIQVLGTIADSAYDEAGKCYKRSDETLNEISQASFSGYLPLQQEPVSILLQTVLPGEPKLSESITVIQGLGIEFYVHSFKEYIPLTVGRAMQIVDAF